MTPHPHPPLDPRQRCGVRFLLMLTPPWTTATWALILESAPAAIPDLMATIPAQPDDDGYWRLVTPPPQTACSPLRAPRRHAGGAWGVG
jgi:hypothetical protein